MKREELVQRVAEWPTSRRNYRAWYDRATDSDCVLGAALEVVGVPKGSIAVEAARCVEILLLVSSPGRIYLGLHNPLLPKRFRWSRAVRRLKRALREEIPDYVPPAQESRPSPTPVGFPEREEELVGV